MIHPFISDCENMQVNVGGLCCNSGQVNDNGVCANQCSTLRPVENNGVCECAVGFVNLGNGLCCDPNQVAGNGLCVQELQRREAVMESCIGE